MAGEIYTLKQELEGILTREANLNVSVISDPVAVLSEGKIKHVTQNTITDFVSADANAVTITDSKGVVSGNEDKASYADRTFTSNSFSMPNPSKINFSIPLKDQHLFGITAEMLSRPADSISADSIVKFSQQINVEFAKLVRKIKQFRRTQVVNLLKGLGAGSVAYQKPLGLEAVALAGGRANNWNYTNKLAAALDETSYNSAVDILAGGQKTVDNLPYGLSKPIMLLHASSFSLAESIHLPDLSVNIMQRTAGDSIEYTQANVKAVGVYGDTSKTSDWILLGENHEIHRIAQVSPFGEETNGIYARIFVNPTTGEINIELWDNSIMAVSSPIDIVKSILA